MLAHPDSDHTHARRLFLKFLAGSPLLYSPLVSCVPKSENSHLDSSLIQSPEDALNVFDFQAVAENTLPPAHYGYLATGVRDDRTLLRNEEAFHEIRIRMHRLIHVSGLDTSVNILDKNWHSPIIIAPCGSQKAFHDEGELGVARAARSRDHLQILSTVSTTAVEHVVEARGEPVWFQLYPSKDWGETREMLRRAEDAGSPAVVLTVDLTAGDENRETLQRMIRTDTRQCQDCHIKEGIEGYIRNKPMVSQFSHFDLEHNLTWDYVDQLKTETSMKVILKGIVTSEDAQLCLDHEVDGVIVSNHGGRATESGRSTIECLPEVAKTIDGQLPVLIDSGIRRGTDIFKALALGADAVCIGRPYLWGLAAFGQAGVEAVLEMLTGELQMVMKQAGTANLAAITSAHVEHSFG